MSLKSLSNPSSKLTVHSGKTPVTWICPGLPVNPEWKENAMTVPPGYGPGNGHVSVVNWQPLVVSVCVSGLVSVIVFPCAAHSVPITWMTKEDSSSRTMVLDTTTVVEPSSPGCRRGRELSGTTARSGAISGACGGTRSSQAASSPAAVASADVRIVRRGAVRRRRTRILTSWRRDGRQEDTPACALDR